MRFAIVLGLVACSSAAPRPAAPAAPARPPALADLGWLVGSWHGDALDQRYALAAGTLWGVTLGERGFEVDLLRDRGGHVELFDLEGGQTAVTLPLVSSTPGRAEFAAGDRFGFERVGDQLRTTFARDAEVGARFPVTRIADVRAPELEAADLAFAADSAQRGAAAWVDVMAPDGALWRKPGRVSGADAIRADAATTLAAGALTWRPIVSGVRGDWGYTIGTYTFVPTGATAQPETGSYCTIWHRIAGAWRVALDLGA